MGSTIMIIIRPMLISWTNTNCLVYIKKQVPKKRNPDPKCHQPVTSYLGCMKVLFQGIACRPQIVFLGPKRLKSYIMMILLVWVPIDWNPILWRCWALSIEIHIIRDVSSSNPKEFESLIIKMLAIWVLWGWNSII